MRCFMCPRSRRVQFKAALLLPVFWGVVIWRKSRHGKWFDELAERKLCDVRPSKASFNPQEQNADEACVLSSLLVCMFCWRTLGCLTLILNDINEETTMRSISQVVLEQEGVLLSTGLPHHCSVLLLFSPLLRVLLSLSASSCDTSSCWILLSEETELAHLGFPETRPEDEDLRILLMSRLP